MIAGRIALYARVSSEAQARDNTIASQVASLQDRIAGDGYLLEPDDCYVDEGYSGSVLLRPALERLRDAAASGRIERVYVHAPDRLARRYAHQALIIDELRRAGVEIVFRKRRQTSRRLRRSKPTQAKMNRTIRASSSTTSKRAIPPPSARLT